MKTKEIILFGLLFLIGASATAQKKGKLGLMAGWNYATSSSKNLDTKSISAFYGGAVWEHKIVPSFRYYSGIIYNQAGYGVDEDNNLDKAKYSYLTVPLIAKVQILNFYALGGLSSGIRTGGKYYFTDETETKITTDNLKGYDFAAQFGLGFKIAIIGIEAKYNWGLTDINNNSALKSIYNRYFQLGLLLKL